MGATQPLLIIAGTGLPQAEGQDPWVCIYTSLHACNHSTCTVRCWYICTCQFICKQYMYVCVCVLPRYPTVPHFCTHLKGYNIQNPFIKVIKQSFIAPVWVCVSVCMNVHSSLCFVYVEVNFCVCSFDLKQNIGNVRPCDRMYEMCMCVLCLLVQYVHGCMCQIICGLT